MKLKKPLPGVPALSAIGVLMASIVAVSASTWPDLAGRVGPYGGIVTVGDARQMTADGLSVTLLSSVGPDVLAALKSGGAKYIDHFFWRQIRQRCAAHYQQETATHQPLACRLSADENQAIVQAATTHLRAVEADPGLVAFWILDDFPHGDISVTLRALHALVQRSNVSSGVARPTMCGIGGSLDAKRSFFDAQFTPDRGYMEQSLVNLSPDACDVVSPYFYGAAASDDPRLIDWAMKALLPDFLQRLRGRGFDTGTQLLVPVSHAFSHAGRASSYVTPRPADIAAQMSAYCDAGAFSMLFFTWQSADADRSYSSDASIRLGVQQGRDACARRWSTSGSRR